MMRFFAALTLATCLAAPLFAGDVAPCDWRASAANIAEPWEENSRTFANGDVRVALLDTVEPAAGAFHLLVIAPPYDELGYPGCSVVSFDGSMGYGGIAFEVLEAGYNPNLGLVLTMPAYTFDGSDGDMRRILLSLAINQSTGEILWSEEDLPE